MEKSQLSRQIISKKREYKDGFAFAIMNRLLNFCESFLRIKLFLQPVSMETVPHQSETD